MEFTEKLMSILNERKISKSELGRNTKISESTIRSWEKGSQPTLDKLIRISQYLKISLDELCCNTVTTKNRHLELINNYEKANPGIKEAVNKLLNLKEEIEEMSSDKKIG